MSPANLESDVKSSHAVSVLHVNLEFLGLKNRRIGVAFMIFMVYIHSKIEIPGTFILLLKWKFLCSVSYPSYIPNINPLYIQTLLEKISKNESSQ